MLPYLASQDVAELLQVARVRILRFLKRQGAVVETRPLEPSEANAIDEEGLQQLAAAAVTGQAPARPELRQRGADAPNSPQRVSTRLAQSVKVVVSGAFKLRNGAPVTIDNSVMPEAELAPQPRNR